MCPGLHERSEDSFHLSVVRFSGSHLESVSRIDNVGAWARPAFANVARRDDPFGSAKGGCVTTGEPAPTHVLKRAPC